MKICRKRGLYLLGDCTRAHGAAYNGKLVGNFGSMDFFSFYPTQNLGGFGDGGMILTEDEALRDKLRCLRNYGSAKRHQTIRAKRRAELGVGEGTPLLVHAGKLEPMKRTDTLLRPGNAGLPGLGGAAVSVKAGNGILKITVIGTGYVGLVAGLGFAKWGNDVVCLDVDEEKIEKLRQGTCPIYEPGATTQLQEGLASGRLRFTTDTAEAVRHGTLIFIAVGTPEREDGSADLRYVEAAADDVAEYMDDSKIVVDKSTVPVGTARSLQSRIRARLDALGKENLKISVVSNPEFLREGKAIGNFNNPERIVLGVPDEIAGEKLRKLYRGFIRSNKPIIVTTPKTEEMIKYASNAFLATKNTFINKRALGV